jgi:hypothetical protein
VAVDDDDAFLLGHLAGAQRDIDARGFAIQCVLGDAEHLAFAYTIGLHLLDRPELLVFGPDPDTAYPMLGSIAAQVVDGRRLADGDVLDDTIAGRPMRVMEVLDSREHLLYAHVHARTAGPLPALQVIYPDIHGVWPWQPGSRIADVPLLGVVPDLRGGAGPGR